MLCSKRVCLIDTPGVNSAINRNHGRITKKALTNEKFDKVIYVLNANKLGTEEEMAYLKWFVNNVYYPQMVCYKYSTYYPYILLAMFWQFFSR